MSIRLKNIKRNYLKSIKGLELIRVGKEVEGKDFLNLSKDSELEIGKKLSIGYPLEKPIKTIFGEIGNLRTGLDFLNTPGYPLNILKKSKLSRKDIQEIPNGKKFEVPNYWSAATYLIWERIKIDETLIEELRNLPKDIKLTVFTKTVIDVNGIESTRIKYHHHMNNYVAIIRNIKDILQNTDKSNWDKEVVDLIMKIKVKDDLGVFDNLPTPVVVDEEKLFNL